MRSVNPLIVALATATLAMGIIVVPGSGLCEEKTSALSTGELAAYTVALARMDTKLAGALDNNATGNSKETQEALRALRNQANTLVYRITQSLADDYPCQPTKLPAASRDTKLPEPNERIAFDVAPKLVSMDPAVYPEEALQLRIEGTVFVRILVSREGVVEDSIVIQSVPGLDAAADASARSAVFTPALQNGQPVAVWMVMPVEFSLRG